MKDDNVAKNIFILVLCILKDIKLAYDEYFSA